MPHEVDLGKTLVAPGDRVSLDRAGGDVLSTVDVETRYSPVVSLGEGGMGEVWLTRDLVIGRDIAMKSVKKPYESEESLRARFLREARVQGQLSHPSIVPVHDLGTTADGRLYFTMQHIRGRSLEELAKTLSRHAALTAMSRICLAIDFAHAHGVIHRDIKLSNLMLGDFGEVYVLDWGIAKLVEKTEVAFSGGHAADPEGGPVEATVGSILGTPGFMSPEQLQGREVDERADVYALGACLFQLLARKPLHEGHTVAAVVASTIASADARPSVRSPEADVPPELDAICVRATTTDPKDRFPTARAMHDAIERFLEGDRDVERRRALSAEHAASASKLAKAALHDGSTEARAQAMREIGRALALDAGNAAAMQTLVELLTDPPRVLPPDVEAQMEEEREARVLSARRYAGYAFLSTFIALPFALAMGVREWRWFWWILVCGLGGAGVALFSPRLGRDTVRRNIVVAFGIVGLVAMSRVGGPFMIVPVMGMGLGAGLALFPRHIPLAACIGVGGAAVVVPLALELVGVLPRSYEFTADAIVVHAQLASFPMGPTVGYFLVILLGPLIAVCAYVIRIRDRLLEAEGRIRVQAWQLRQIVGGERRG